MKRRALQLASVASMIDLFNTDNIRVLRSLGYSVDVAANFEEGSITSQERVNEYREELRAQNIGTYQIPIPRSIKKVGNIVKSYKMVKHLVEEKKYQIVHCHSPIGGVICRLACRRARNKYGTKVIYTAHGFHFFKGASKAAWFIYYPIERWCSKYTDILITINQEDFHNAKKMKAKKVEYVPGIGIPVEEIRNIKVDRDRRRAEFGYKDSDFVFMSTGQISMRKNHEVVIRALSLLKDKENRMKYLIVGFGEEKDRLTRLVREFGLERAVIFAGYRSDVKELLHCVDAFVFPSIQEGLPVALMEAMAAGLPIVASRIRGNVDLIEDGVNGYLAEYDSPENFKSRMERAMTTDTFNMTENNKHRIMEFHADKVKAKMTNIYLSISGTWKKEL